MKLKVLMVEDRETDAMLVMQALRRGGLEVESRRVDSGPAMRAALAAEVWDVIISDYSLPQFSGIEALRAARESGMDIPFIIVSGAIGEDTAVAAMKAGAHDYVMKDNLARLYPAVLRELREAEGRRVQRQMEARLRASERLELIGQLVLGVAHEVRNPLNCIMAVSEALGEEIGDKPEYKTYIDYIHEQVDRLAELVRDLLDMGKPLDPSRMHRGVLSNIVSAGLALWKEAHPNNGHMVTLVCPPEAQALEVVADGARLQQVFINLIDNAAHQSPAENEVRVEVAGPGGDGLLSVRVIDRGVGIAPEDREKLFRPFFTTRKGGTGLGLCIVQRVIRDHEGDVTIVNNNPPPGCTVEVRLPPVKV